MASLPPAQPVSIFPFQSSRTSSPQREDRYHSSAAPESDGQICDLRHSEEHHSRLSSIPTTLMREAVAPFMKENARVLYAPVGKAENEETSKRKDPNSRYCYRHRPDSKCRRAADERKMALIQRDLSMLPASDQEVITHIWSLFSAAPAKHRELMLQGIMNQCCFSQLSTISREVQDQLKIDFLTVLPTEIAIQILRNLDTVSLCKAAQVSRRWRQLADDDAVWHTLCCQHISRKCTKCGWGLPLLEKKRLRGWTRQRQLAHRDQDGGDVGTPRSNTADPSPSTAVSVTSPSSRPAKRNGSADTLPAAKRACVERPEDELGPWLNQQLRQESQYRPWKEVYRERWAVGSNWKRGRYNIRVLNSHTNGITCLQLDESNNILATGSYDTTIKIWNLETGEEIRTLRGHDRGIRALRFDDSKLFSGSLDGSVRVWNWRTGDQLSSISSNSGVISVDFDGEIMVSGSMDKLLRVWNFKTNQMFCLRGHKDWVNQVRIDLASRTILSASDDCQIRLWDLDSKRCLKKFVGHIGHVQQVLPMPEDFELDTDVEAIHTNPHPNDADESDSASITSGWSTTTATKVLPTTLSNGEDMRQLFGEPFTSDPSRPLPPAYFVSGGLDATMRLWSMATGKCLKTWFGHLEGIWGLEGDTLRVVSGSNDGMVKVWDPRSGRCERTFGGHRGPVTCVGLSDSLMVTGGEDGEVRLYSFHAIGLSGEGAGGDLGV